MTTAAGKVHLADQVVVTVPLGILRDNDITFKPELPKAKREAIQRIGVGLLDKLYLEFDQCFWNPKTDWIAQVSDDWSLALNCQKHNTGKPLLCLFNHGAQCRKYSELSDEQVVESAMHAIKRMYPEAPDCKSYLRTNWLKDQYAKMSYCFVAAGGTPADFTTLAASIQNKVHFAGEHTLHDFLGCTHSAYISGVRAAEKIKSYYESRKGGEDDAVNKAVEKLKIVPK